MVAKGKKHITLVIDIGLLEKLKDYAYTERITQTEALHRALKDYLKDKDNLLKHSWYSYGSGRKDNSMKKLKKKTIKLIKKQMKMIDKLLDKKSLDTEKIYESARSLNHLISGLEKIDRTQE